MKRFLFPVLTAFIAILISATCIEVIATVYLYAREGRYVPARVRFQSRTNTFVQALKNNRDCAYLDTLYPHPYLGFVHHGNPPCGLPEVNNIGLFGPDFPSVHRDDRFVVLLTGGSVANQFGRSVQGNGPYLERFLNEQFESPSGKPFLILNGADGAWKQPQQAIIFLIYADAVDAVVTLDGFNEHYMIGTGLRFEYPASNFQAVNPLATQAFGDVVARWYTGRLREFAAANPLLSRSQAAYTIVAGAEDYLARRTRERPEPKTTVESLFTLPPEWSEDRRKAWAIDQYRKYIRAMQAIATLYHLPTAFFIQPAPALGKTLTPDEQRVTGDLGYKMLYEEMTNELMALNRDAIPVVSLLDIFATETRTLYGDPIHLIRAGDGSNSSPGHEIMARRMAADLGRLWHLQARGDR